MFWGMSLHDEGELSLDFFNHVLSGVSDGGHGESGESVWDHSSEEETSKGVGVKDVNGDFGVRVLRVLGFLEFFNTGDEGTEKSKCNEAGGSNGETFTNSGGSVTCGIEFISSFSNFF